MAILHGMLNLSKIDKKQIVTNKHGDKCIWVDLADIYNAPDQYGNTHYLSMWDPEARQKIYLANLKPKEFAAKQEPANEESAPTEDLPF